MQKLYICLTFLAFYHFLRYNIIMSLFLDSGGYLWNKLFGIWFLAMNFSTRLVRCLMAGRNGSSLWLQRKPSSTIERTMRSSPSGSLRIFFILIPGRAHLLMKKMIKKCPLMASSNFLLDWLEKPKKQRILWNRNVSEFLFNIAKQMNLLSYLMYFQALLYL